MVDITADISHAVYANVLFYIHDKEPSASTMTILSHEQEGLQMQRDQAMHFVTCNNKSDLQTHSSSLAFVAFNKPYMISY